MNYINSKLFQVQIIIQLVLICLCYLIDFNVNTQAIICGILLCSVGIPHGSNDYLYRSNFSKSGLVKFLITYISLMFLYAIVWWFLPILALIIFFFISIHHFGQSNFENTKVFYLPSIFWGGWVLLYPVFIHSNEAFTIFKQMIAANNFNIEIIKYPINDKFKFIILGGFSLFYFLILRYFEKENLLKYFLQFVIVTIWYLFTPLLFGFIIFFCLWHSLQSLNHQSEYYLEISKNNLADFVLKMVPFSLIALGLFGIYVYIRGFILSEAFILLSLITFPHVIIMHKLYKKAPLGLIK